MFYIIETQNTGPNALNVRSGPGTNHDTVANLSKGDLVEVITSVGEWSQIGPDQWVHNNYLRQAAPDERFILPHYRWPGDPARKLIAGFDTGKTDLKPQHFQWLSSYVAQRAKLGQWVFLRGYASKLGNPQFNLQLSNRRAQAVKDFLISQCGAPPERITGYGGVGEQWSSGDVTDNSPKWRAVEVIVSEGVFEGPVTHITNDALGSEFSIKYLGGGGVDPPPGIEIDIIPDIFPGLGPDINFQIHEFIVRNARNWHVLYPAPFVGVSIGSPFSLGNKLPPGEGWVPFQTSDFRTVDSFGGKATLFSIGPNFFRLRVPDVFQVDIPTGPGVNLDLSASVSFDWKPYIATLTNSTSWQFI